MTEQAGQGTMTRLTGWTARRAGGRITVVHDGGKVPNVDAITCEDGRIVATASDGRRYELAATSGVWIEGHQPAEASEGPRT